MSQRVLLDGSRHLMLLPITVPLTSITARLKVELMDRIIIGSPHTKITAKASNFDFE
jgi:hypothetical protein